MLLCLLSSVPTPHLLTLFHLLPAEFTSALCGETWTVADGKCAIEGGPVVKDADKNAMAHIGPETMVDAFGNVSKVKQPKKMLSNKEKKKRDRIRALRRKNGEEVSDSDEEDW